MRFEPEEATQPEARSSSGPEVGRGGGMPGLLTGHVRSAEFKDDSEHRVDVCGAICHNSYSRMV